MIKSDNAQKPKMEMLVSRRSIRPGASLESVLPHWVIGLVFDGALEQGPPNGKRFVARKGDFSVIRGHMPQRWLVVGKKACSGIDCIFDPRPHWISWLNMAEIAPGFMIVPLRDSKVRRKVREGLARAYRLGQSGTPEAMDFVYNEIEKVILLVNRYYRQCGVATYDSRVGKAVQYLTENLAVHMGLKEVAAYCGLSRAQLAFLFKEQVGIGPIAFQNEQRIARAKQMLRMSFLSVKQIALELGFKNPKYFSSCFRRISGIGPRQYRMKDSALA